MDCKQPHTQLFVLHIRSLVIRQCKGDGAIPTVDVTGTTFIAPRGILFCKVVKSECYMHCMRFYQPKRLLYLFLLLFLVRPMAASG